MHNKPLWKILAIAFVLLMLVSCAMPSIAVNDESPDNTLNPLNDIFPSENTTADNTPFPLSSNIIYMPDNYSLIRLAADNASLGDMIVVYNETYKENVTVNRLGASTVQMNNLTDSVTSVSEWETAKILTLLSTDTDSIQLISITPPTGTTLQRGTYVPFEVTVDYNLASVATGFVGARLVDLPTGRAVGFRREEIMQGHGTAIIRGSINVDHLYKLVQSDTVFLLLSLGYKINQTHNYLLIRKHMPDQCYFIASAPTSTPTPTPTLTPPDHQLPIANASGFDGLWLNIDKNTRGITKIEIKKIDYNHLSIHPWGKCHPTDCDWGARTFEVENNPFTITWTESFCTREMTFTLQEKDILHVHSFTHFTDNSGRPDYHADGYFESYFKPPKSHPPTANAHGPYSANINEPIQFYGSGTDPDGDAIIAYAWDFDNDGITDSTLQNPTHSWSVAGTYYPTLKVQDEKGAWSSPSKCTVLITTPPSYDGDLTGVYSQSHYSTGESVNIGVDIKNTGNTAETYDLHLVVHDKHGASVYDFGSVVSADDLGEFSATAYHCVYESEMAGTQTVTKTISGTTYTLKASFLFGGYGVAMQGTGRTGPSGDYIHCTNPAELSFVHINNPQEFTDEIRQRYTNLGITDFTGFGNLALTHPEQAEYSVVSGITGASSRTLIPWYSIAVDPSEIPLGTTGTLLFKGGSTTPEGVTQMSFRADDTGEGIVGKHIDIYVGEGQSAIGKWYQTGGNRNVEVHTGDELNIYLSPGAKTTEKFSMAPLPVGQYSFIVYLNSSSSGSVYDYTNGNFRVLNLDALNVIEKDAEPLKAAALDEVDEMVILTSNTMFDMVFSLSWKLVKGTFEGKIKEIIDNFDIFQGVLDQIYTKLGAIIDAFGVEEKLESKLYEAYKGYTASEEIKIIEQDVSFGNFIVDRAFARDDNIIQVFKEGESAISEIMESGEIQKQRDRYEDLERLDESWWTFEIPKIGMVGSAFSMVASLPYTASEVTSKHSSILENIKYLILQQSTSKASILSVSADSQTVVGEETKISITVDKKPFFQKESFTKEITSEPIIGIVVSPDGRIIDMSLYQTDPYANYETLSSSIRRPHQPGKYKILAMTCSDMASSSVKQAVITQTAPNVSVSISTDKQFYNFSETVTINATFINTGPEKIGNLTYCINIQNTTHNKTGFLEIDANSSKVETLVFTPQTNGTYKAIVTLFIELYFADFAETGFTVENGTGVSVNIDSKEVYDPNTNVTASLTIKNVGTELYQGDITVTTVDTLNDYLEVYNSIEPLSVNESEEKELQCIILAKGSSEPGIYRSYIEIDNSTYIVPFTVAANGTIFITVQTDKLIYSDLESAIVNISVKDVAFNATNATLNVTSADPNGNKAYFDVTGSKGNYSTIIPPDNKSVNGTYNILVTGTKEGYRVYSDQTFFIVNERTKLRCDIPRIIQLNTTDTINLFVETDTNQSVKDAFVTLTGCGFNATRTTDENGLVVFGTDSMNRTGVIEVNIEKGGYGSFIGKMEVIGKEENIFDTNAPLNPYPSIMRNHTGTIKPNHTVIATKLYTYSCEGTGGHTEYARIWNKTWNATATWEGYVGDWKNISFDKTVVLLANEEYNYTIRTGSYPQIHHKPELPTENGWINCTEFVDANGKKYYNWIPAIRLE